MSRVKGEGSANRKLLPTPPTQQGHTDGRQKRLELVLRDTQLAALNKCTSMTYLGYLNVYLNFCEQYGFLPFPLQSRQLCLFAQHLADSRKPQTVEKILGALRTISVQKGFPVSQSQFPEVKLTLMGLRKSNPSPPNRAHPMSTSLLLRIRSNLTLNDPFAATMWALFLTCFFLLLRKSNVTPDKKADRRYLRRSHLVRTTSGYFVNLFWTKTLQQGEYALQFPVFSVPESPLCLTWALDNMIRLVPGSPDSPAFCTPSGAPIYYSTFNSFIKSQIKALGLNPKGWSTHSFRRGGTTYLASCGVEERQIQMLGDWRSNCYKKYIHCPWHDKLELAARVKAFLLKSSR